MKANKLFVRDDIVARLYWTPSSNEGGTMPKYTQARKTCSYTNDFKAKAVELSDQKGIQVKQIAAGLDIHSFMLSRWRKQYHDGTLKSDGLRRVNVSKQKNVPTDKELTELERLRRENSKL